IHPHGARITFATYHGLTLEEQLFRTNAKPATIIAALGTSDRDITGTFGGVAFPVYGTVPCVDPVSHPSICPGKAILYNLIDNHTDEDIGFGQTPRFSLTNAGSFPGKECELISLTRTKAGQWEWVLELMYSRPKDGKISFPSRGRAIFGFSPDTFYTFGFICF
ncbi:MAG TPA: hypothetical protein VK760_16660, partial [Candidatus Acidoferrales bacterium]|nr:hypothetical protein [Candidatus Acidoferrales bacterium]